MRFLILAMLFVSNISYSKDDPLGLDIQPGYFSENCLISVKQCFDKGFVSENNETVVKSILLYLDNYDVMSKHYDYTSLLNKLSEVSKLGDNNLFLVEAIIYFQGFHVLQNANKAVDVLEKNKLLDYDNPLHLMIIGKAYYFLFLENDKKNIEELNKARNYLLQAFNMGREHATRALALILVNSSNIEDVIMAGEVLRYFSESEIGTKLDRDKYNKYLDVMKEKVFGN